MSLIQAKNLVYEYFRRDDSGAVTEEIMALDGVNLDVKEGDFIAIVGHNGSGKSTLAKHINALLFPMEGSIVIDGYDSKDEAHIWDIRQSAGMVFQNPDNQIIGTLVEEDVAFGAENLGVPTEEIWERVGASLEAVGMTAYKTASPNQLSGGQKQRVAIAGVLAMEPKCIILDEATAMLDPQGRKQVLNTMYKIHREKKITVILITHHMEEILYADYAYVMSQGKIALEGKPKEILLQDETIKALRLDTLPIVELANRLRKKGIPISKDMVTREAFVEEIVKCCKGNVSLSQNWKEKPEQKNDRAAVKEGLILDHIHFSYEKDKNEKKEILKDVSLTIGKGEFIALVGHTGSGKSTLIKQFNGLLKPNSGTVYYNGQDIHDRDYKLKELRQKVGMVFQYPEHQLFENTVYDDVCFGPLQMDISKTEAQKRAYEAIEAVGLSEDTYDLSPFALSGGQKRRVAIAGVLAMMPDYLILDEPAAGLDPAGRKEIMGLLNRLHKEQGMTILFVSHSMEDAAEYASRIIVVDEGEIKYDDSPEKVFSQIEALEQMGLAAPESVYVMEALRKRGIKIPKDAVTLEEAADTIEQLLL